MRLAALGSALVFCWVILAIGYISRKGAVVSFTILGTVALLSPTSGADAIVLLFVYAAIVTMSRFRWKTKQALYAKVESVEGRHSVLNVIGKLLPPALLSLMGLPHLMVAVVSYGIADSTGSQIGILSSRPPRLVTSLKIVPPGTNGAVSFLGTVGGLLAGIVVADLYCLLSSAPLICLLYFAMLGAIGGNFIDSLIGATLERPWHIPDWLVNLSACVLTGLLAWILQVSMGTT